MILKLEEGQLTNGKLIEILSKYPDELPIVTKGCDCYGAASEVIHEDNFDNEGACLIINRLKRIRYDIFF